MILRFFFPGGNHRKSTRNGFKIYYKMYRPKYSQILGKNKVYVHALCIYMRPTE